MEDNTMTFRVHHNGEFSKDKYLGGLVQTYEDMDLDRFSYSEFMEWVKDLGYKEIGGVYVRKENDDWILVTNDADMNEAIITSETSDLNLFIDCNVDRTIEPMPQMQPHVIVRPKRSPVQATIRAKENNPKKRQFVTIKEINQEKQRRMINSRKKIQPSSNVASPAKGVGEVSKLPSMELENIKDGEMGLVEYLKIWEKPAEEENLVEGGGEVLEGGVNEYEMRRNKNVAENKKKLQELGLNKEPGAQQKKLKTKVLSSEGGSAYCPENEEDRESNVEEDIVSVKRRKKEKGVVVGTDGPRTRSRASKMSLPSDKQVNTVDVEANDASKVPTAEKLKLIKNNAPGSMATYLQLREREKQAEMENLQSQSQPENLQSQPNQDAPLGAKKRKVRGKSKLSNVHTRGEKPEIKLSEDGTPISDDDDHSLREFSNFLGTVVRDYVSLTCRSWTEVPEKDILWQYVKDKYIIGEEGYQYVMTTMRDQLRGHKATVKRDHYTKYPNDEQRLQNRPRNIPLTDFKILLNYWADEKVQERARKNVLARSKITETHTAGPNSFAQICHKMVIAREQLAKPDEPPAAISDADIYIKTRKREETREYKLPTDVVTKKIEDVQKVLDEGNVEDANKLVYGGKEHSRSYLVGRLIRKKGAKGKLATQAATEMISTSTISDQHLASLTEKIRDQIAQEMDEKLEKKVRENVKMVMSKLAEKCPELKVDIEELSTMEPPSNGDASKADTAS